MNIEDLFELTDRLRNFEVLAYIQTKTRLINQFFKDNKLDSCVLGMSGGADSATVLSLLCHAAAQPASPLKRIVPLILPIYGNGTTGQDAGRALAEKQCKALDCKYYVKDLTPVYEAYLNTDPSLINDAWSNGQLASTIRMPAFYYHAAILQAEDYKSIVVGTTNRDEGSYIGYFGKTSDAMVDLQPIADIHKLEVYEVARLSGVCKEIIDRPPTGDVWNGLTTEEMMSINYSALRMCLLVKEFRLENLIQHLDSSSRDIVNDYMAKIEKLHTKNAHKYEVSMPSKFIDVTPYTHGGISGGW